LHAKPRDLAQGRRWVAACETMVFAQ